MQFSEIFVIFALELTTDCMEERRKDESTLVSEPAAIYYGTSQELRDSGILPELKNFGKEDTIWIIRYLQKHLEELTSSERMKVANPLAMLDQLGDMVKATGKTSEQLVGEHLAEIESQWYSSPGTD